ncbi:integumentary mucin B.1-like [Eleutherodactylus coqui]|uniref:integumentary mucin B.1-like n=1 Tax=Eleutherodactylus coqui TaxID=57060 RepID=UPI00346377E7
MVPVVGPVVPTLPTIDANQYFTSMKECCSPSGEILKDGQSWTIGCNKCTCNGSMGAMSCEPLECGIADCAENERRVFGDPKAESKDSCCGYCEPITCKHNGTDYPIDYIFTDPKNPCVRYTCKQTGVFSALVDTCPKQKYCTKDRRTYDSNGCCYTCDNSCKPSPSSMDLTITYTDSDDYTLRNCSALVKMAKCSGECEEAKPRYDTEIHKIVSDCYCCTDATSEERDIELACEDGSIELYTYSHITSCSCHACSLEFT